MAEIVVHNFSYTQFQSTGRTLIGKEGNVLFNDALNTFILRLHGVGHNAKDHTQIAREETRSRHMGYYFRLAATIIRTIIIIIAVMILLIIIFKITTKKQATGLVILTKSLSTEFPYTFSSNQCFTTGISKIMVCAVLSVGRCI